jgi:hypothetical protein
MAIKEKKKLGQAVRFLIQNGKWTPASVRHAAAIIDQMTVTQFISMGQHFAAPRGRS